MFDYNAYADEMEARRLARVDPKREKIRQNQLAQQGRAFGRPPAGGGVADPSGFVSDTGGSPGFSGGQGNDNGLFAALGAAQDFVGALGPTQQASHLAGMAKNVNKAWSDEMDSRVAQSMDARHMQHSREMMQMQLESRERQQERDLEASRQEMLLRRLGGNSGFMIDGQGNYRST